MKTEELHMLYNDLNIVTIMKKIRLTWAGQMSSTDSAAFGGAVEGQRMRGRVKIRRRDSFDYGPDSSRVDRQRIQCRAGT